MASVILLILVTLGAYLVVLAGAAAYELTGLDRETARFQALSAFTGTGFTTRVSRLVVDHPVRRRITSLLIILGYAGTATVVASLVASVESSFLMSIRNILILGVVGATMGYLLSRLGTQALSDQFRRFLAPRMKLAVSQEELHLYRNGFGLERLEIPEGSLLVGHRLREFHFRGLELQVVAIEDRDEVFPIPDPEHEFRAGQQLVLYGRLDNMRRVLAPGVLTERTVQRRPLEVEDPVAT